MILKAMIVGAFCSIPVYMVLGEAATAVSIWAFGAIWLVLETRARWVRRMDD